MNPLRPVDSFFSAHPVLVDSVVACLLWSMFYATVAEPYTMDTSNLLVKILLYVVSLGMFLPWAIRRVKPELSGGIIALSCVVLLCVGGEILPAGLIVPLTVYNLAARASRWASISGLVTALLGAVGAGTRIALFPDGLFSSDAPDYTGGVTDTILGTLFIIITCAAIVLTAWALGDVQRNRRLARIQAVERAHQLEIEAAQERQLAAADERNHIAREMHDIVAHSLQVIISQADGGRYAGKQDPDVALRTLETISDTSRASLDQMRRLLGVLRGTNIAEHNPQPTLADVEDLLDTVRLTGLEVTSSTHGEPRRELPDGGELVAYRLIQEALTNSSRHGGPGTTADIELTWTNSGLDITINDDGRGAAADPSTQGSGQGLVGMRERVQLYSGDVEAGPQESGGYRVHATIPYRPL